MGRHTGDYLVGTTVLAVAMLFAISQGKSQTMLSQPSERSSVSRMLHASRWTSTSASSLQRPVANTSLQPAHAVLKNLSRGTRIVVGSLDVFGGRHTLAVAVCGDYPVRIGSLPVARCSIDDIRRWGNEKNLHNSVACDVLTPEGLPVSGVCSQGPHASFARVFLTPHFIDNGTMHEATECRFIGESRRVHVYVDHRLVKTTGSEQVKAWSEPLTSAVELRALPIVDAWIGAISDVDHDQKLSIVVTDLDRRRRRASEIPPIHGCIRETDFRSDSDFCGDIVYIDPNVFELPTAELAALLSHEIAHAAICSMRADRSIDAAADPAEFGSQPAGLQVPSWLNEAVAHFVELQCGDADVGAAGMSENFRRRLDDFLANPACSPIVAAEDVLSLEERRSGSRGAATLFLARWFSSSKALEQFLRSPATLDRQIEDLAQEPFADVFRDWTLSLATMSATQAATSGENQMLHTDRLPVAGSNTRFPLLGTGFRCFECSEDVGTLIIESDDAARLQITIIEPEAHITTMANAATQN